MISQPPQVLHALQRFVDIDAVARAFACIQETILESVIVREDRVGFFISCCYYITDWLYFMES